MHYFKNVVLNTEFTPRNYSLNAFYVPLQIIETYFIYLWKVDGFLWIAHVLSDLYITCILYSQVQGLPLSRLKHPKMPANLTGICCHLLDD
jgi:hypothetical protein